MKQAGLSFQTAPLVYTRSFTLSNARNSYPQSFPLPSDLTNVTEEHITCFSLPYLFADYPKVSIYNQVVLTLREKEILQLVAKGKSNQDIVEELFLSINTIKNYLARIFLKLDVKNRAELTRKALQMGIVE